MCLLRHHHGFRKLRPTVFVNHMALCNSSIVRKTQPFLSFSKIKILINVMPEQKNSKLRFCSTCAVSYTCQIFVLIVHRKKYPSLPWGQIVLRPKSVLQSSCALSKYLSKYYKNINK